MAVTIEFSCLFEFCYALVEISLTLTAEWIERAEPVFDTRLRPVQQPCDSTWLQLSSGRAWNERVKMFRSSCDLRVIALLVACLFHGSAVSAQDSDMIWTSSQTNGAGGTGSAQLNRQVPETDNVQVSATCGANSPDNATSFMVGVDTGDLKSGEQTRLRFFGGGKEYEYSGRAVVPSSEEGLQGVEVVLPHTDPLWDALTANASLRYQIPGYQSQDLPLAAGHNAINTYLTTCKTLATKTSSGDTSAATDPGVKDAFSDVRNLNTAAGYQAFISAYPTGFYADLAKAHLKKLQSGRGESTANVQDPPAQQSAQHPTTTPPLPTYTVGPGNTPWYRTAYNGNANAAGVSSGGLELIAYCTSGREVGMAVRSVADGHYPQFRERIQQGLQRDRTADLNFQGEGAFRAMFQSNDGEELNMSYPVATSNGIVRSLMSGKTLLLSRPPFAALFQLQGSRSVICEALNGCGAFMPECGSQGSVASDKPTETERCSSRSVYVKGRGCVLKKYSGTSGSKKGCGGGEIRVEGKCMSRSASVGFCGPGYRVRGGKCVHQNEVGKKTKTKTKMLKRNEGGFISEADCKRRGMIPEFGYCVEND